MKITSTILTILFIASVAYASTFYLMDKNHSQLGFSITHFGISNVEGKFNEFEASLLSSKEDFSDAKITMTARVSSINTGVDKRDEDLKSPNWFDAVKFPDINFTGTAFTKQFGNNFKLQGDITIHGITRPIDLDVVYNGKMQSPYTKKYIVGFTISGKLNRMDFNIGGKDTSSVGSIVDIKSNVEFKVN